MTYNETGSGGALGGGIGTFEQTTYLSVSGSKVVWQSFDISSYFNHVGITIEGTNYDGNDDYGLDGNAGGTFSANLLSNEYFWTNQGFQLGNPNADNVIQCDSQTITLDGGISYNTLYVLATTADGPITGQSLTVYYTDGTNSTFTQNFSDWAVPQSYSNETQLVTITDRNESDGSSNSDSEHGFSIYGYSFSLQPGKIVSSLQLPESSSVFIFAINQAINVPSMLLWTSGDFLPGVGNGDDVNNWADRSLNGNSLVEGSAPTLTTNFINGLPAVNFTAVDENYLQSTFSGSDTNYSIVVLFKSKVTDTFEVSLSWGPGGAGTFWTGYIVNEEAESNHLIVCSDSSNDIYDTNIFSDTNWHICSSVHTSGSMLGYDDGIQVIGSTDGNFDSSERNGNLFTAGSYAGSQYFWDGYIAEIIVAGESLDDTTRSALENYLQTKYGLGFIVGIGNASVGGTGIVLADYGIIGSGNAEVLADFTIDATYLITDDDFYITTEDGYDLITESGESIGSYTDNSSVTHIVMGAGDAVVHGTGNVEFTVPGPTYNEVGSGDVVAAGVGTVIYRPFIATTYSEIGSGGAVSIGTVSNVNYAPGQYSQLATACKLNREEFVVCRKAYVPSLTRCNQKIVTALINKFNKGQYA